MIEFICATRADAAEFRTSPLAQSLTRHSRRMDFVAHISLENRRGLPDIYNERIDEGDDDNIVVFLHDDIWLLDKDLDERIEAGLQAFDIVGVAGNTRLLPRAESWAFRGAIADGEFDYPHLSGQVRHIMQNQEVLADYGPWPRQCELLDGLLLAARRGTLRRSGLRFDPQFQFHFYDMDVCRRANLAGLRIGTWPMTVVHMSTGSLNSAWAAAYRVYLDKWGE